MAAKDLPHISMIHYAAKTGNLLLLTSHDSTEVEIRDYIHHERYHQETLMIACRHNRLEVEEYPMWLAVYDISDGRAINAAAAAGHAEVLQCLLRLGRYPVRQYSDVLLLSAAKSGHEAVIEVLAEAGANFSNCDEGTMRKIIESAAINGHDAVIRTLSCSRVQALLARTHTIALQLAAGNGHVAATRALLESGVPVDKRNPRGQTALHVAAESGHSAVAETLFEHGADPFLVANHETPIHLAAKAGHINVLEFFNRRAGLTNFDSTRDLSLYDPRRTALHSAAAGCHGYVIFVIRWLVENGADVNSIDHKYDTPLNVAITQGNETAVRVFLELGATVVGKSASTRGVTAHKYTLSCAAKGLNLFILRMVLENVERDRQVPYQTKHQLIIAALASARALGSDEAAKLLEQASDRLSIGFLKE